MSLVEQKITLREAVLLQISNYHTKTKVQSHQTNEVHRCAGLLLGRYETDGVIATATADLKFTLSSLNGEITSIDLELINEYIQMEKSAQNVNGLIGWTNTEIVGWYVTNGRGDTTSKAISASEQAIHKEIMKFMEKPPVLLVFDSTQDRVTSRRIGLQCYVLVGEGSKVFWSEIRAGVEADRAEQVSIEHLQRNLDSTGRDESQFVKAAAPTLSAVKFLGDKLEKLISELKSNPELAKNQKFRNQVAKLISLYPQGNGEMSKSETLKSFLENNLVSAMTIYLQTADQLSIFNRKKPFESQVYDREGFEQDYDV